MLCLLAFLVNVFSKYVVFCSIWIDRRTLYDFFAMSLVLLLCFKQSFFASGASVFFRRDLLKDSEAMLRCFLPSGKHVEDWGFIVAKLYYRFWFVRCLCFLTSNVFAEKTKKEDSGSVVKSEAKPDRPGNLCCYSQRVCNLEKLKGFDFCHKHILEDKASPFKPCDFVAKSNGRRCPNPAPKLPDRGKR